MITLKSSVSDGSEFQVYDGEMLLGHIRKQKGVSGDKYQAFTDKDGKEECNGKAFESPDDALRWIEFSR